MPDRQNFVVILKNSQLLGNDFRNLGVIFLSHTANPNIYNQVIFIMMQDRQLNMKLL